MLLLGSFSLKELKIYEGCIAAHQSGVCVVGNGECMYVPSLKGWHEEVWKVSEGAKPGLVVFQDYVC